MRPRALTLLGVVFLMACPPAPAAAGIDGCWINAPGDSVIELDSSDGTVRGRVVGLAEPVYGTDEGRGTPGAARVDLNNPDIQLRTRAIAGLYIVRQLRRDGDEDWTGGTIYDPRSGRTYSARAELDADGTLKLRGYVGVPMFGLTTRWTPASRDAAAAASMIHKLAPFMPADAPPPACSTG